jgi:type IV pilus assembly protein PilE
MRPAGFTLVEMAIVLAVSTLLAGLAWPSMHARLVAARRIDATQALQSVQWAQERHRSAHGLYASDLGALGRSADSAQGLYRIELQAVGGDRYLALAHPVAGGSQADDEACAEITLRVEQGFASPGPNRRCWGR